MCDWMTASELSRLREEAALFVQSVVRRESTVAGRAWRHVRRHFVGYIALIIALTMTPLPAYAAAKIGPKGLKKGAVTAPKIKKGAVTAGKIRNGAVGPAKLKNGAVTADKLAEGAVTESSLAEGAVTGGRLSEGAVTGTKFGPVVRRSASTSLASGTTGAANVACETDEQLLSGGADTGGVGFDADWHVVRSGPNAFATGWTAVAHNGTASSGQLIVHVLCVTR